jgi:hypothetical protein
VNTCAKRNQGPFIISFGRPTVEAAVHREAEVIFGIILLNDTNNNLVWIGSSIEDTSDCFATPLSVWYGRKEGDG